MKTEPQPCICETWRGEMARTWSPIVSIIRTLEDAVLHVPSICIRLVIICDVCGEELFDWIKLPPRNLEEIDD